MRKKLAVFAGVVVLGVMTGGQFSGSLAASGGSTIKVVGKNSFVKNALIQSTFRFSPGRKIVKSGSTVTLWNKSTPEPHTLSIVGRKALPKNVAEVFGCKACGPFHKKPDANAGKPGFNRRGDSRFVPVGKSVKFKVTAPAGKTLHYLCAIHPWMQGSIVVR